jgi:hypothetical protein
MESEFMTLYNLNHLWNPSGETKAMLNTHDHRACASLPRKATDVVRVVVTNCDCHAVDKHVVQHSWPSASHSFAHVHSRAARSSIWYDIS